MAKLIGRTQEKKMLKSALGSSKPELLVIYGRRRVGKTFLVRQVYKSQIQFELSGLHHGTLKDQLTNFRNRLSEKGFVKKRAANWLEAFGQLETFICQLKSKRKKVIFIDEFPWLATRRSKFLMAFENFWNSFVSKRPDLLVVICGSAASYMVKNLIRNRGGLHNRITKRIRLLPFNLHETQLFLNHKGIRFTTYDYLQIYMAIGGVPHYLEHLQVGESVAQSIDRLFFFKDAPLRTEFLDLFASLFENPERHSMLIKLLAKSRRGLTRTQIIVKTKIQSGGRLSKTLGELEESGFIEKSVAFGHNKKGALYRLSDEYSLFYLSFIQKTTAKGRGSWLKKFNSQSYKSWLGFCFEAVCLKHIEQIKTDLGISEIYSENYSWVERNTEQGAQIDLLIDRADNVINICEMKFYNGPFTINKRYASEVRNKLNTFRANTQTTKNIFFTMLTTYGLKENGYSTELVQNQVSIESLFRK